MGRFMSPSFWIGVIVATVFTMIMIYAIKKVSIKYNVPVLSTVSEGV
ncbi:hypothetical protein [Paenibacillus sp. MER 99-2]|nr:hypothetical protein [Paenibacillus sp. MER 99-2]MCM3176224.1 hypothetical protein [Paenibacillus sp. MER 99-2]